MSERLHVLSYKVPHANNNEEGMVPGQNQVEAIECMSENILTRARFCIVESCGAGKTLEMITALQASEYAKEKSRETGMDLILADERYVVKNMETELRRFGMEYGKWAEGVKDLHPVRTIASIQSLQHSLDVGRLDSDLQYRVSLCILDEVDKMMTRGRRQIINSLNPSTVIGFTATEERSDGSHISDAYGPVAHRLAMPEAMERGINVVPHFIVYGSEIPESALKRVDGEYEQKSLNAAWKRWEIHKALPKIYNHIVPKNRRREVPGLVFVPSVDAVKDTVSEFQEAFPDIETIGIHGKVGGNVLDRAKEAFHSGNIQMIVLCEMGGRSLNLENAQLLIDAYPTLSRPKLQQRHGRLLRIIREGSPLWEMGWRKEGAILAQLLPQSNTFRPRLFTDLFEEGQYQRLRDRTYDYYDRGTEVGAPQGEIIREILERLKRKKIEPYLSVDQHMHCVELLSPSTISALNTEPPVVNDDGFAWVTRRIKKPIS